MDNDLLGPPGQSRESRRQRVIHILWNEGIRITRELEVHGRNATALERNQLTAIEDILEWTITDGFDSMKELLCVALWNALDSRCVAGKDANLTEIAAVRLLAALMDRGVIRMYASRCRLEDWADMSTTVVSLTKASV